MIQPASAVEADVTIKRSKIEHNTNGIYAQATAGTIRAVISDSLVSGNTVNGVVEGGGLSDWIVIDQTEVSANADGLLAAGSNAEMLVRNTSIFNNTTGLSVSGGGVIYSYGTNSLNGNGTNGAFTGTIAMK